MNKCVRVLKVNNMSIILAKKERNKILIGSDSQETYGEDCKENVLNSKLKQIEHGIYIGGAGDAHVCNMLYTYSEKYSLKNVNTNMAIIEYFSEFSSWLKELVDLESDDKVNPLALCQFIIINDNKLWQFINYYVREINEGEYVAIGSGSQSALTCTRLSNSIEDILKAVCSTNIYCGLPLKLMEIDI